MLFNVVVSGLFDGVCGCSDMIFDVLGRLSVLNRLFCRLLFLVLFRMVLIFGGVCLGGVLGVFGVGVVVLILVGMGLFGDGLRVVINLMFFFFSSFCMFLMVMFFLCSSFLMLLSKDMFCG